MSRREERDLLLSVVDVEDLGVVNFQVLAFY